MKSHLILGGRPSVSGRSCNKRMVVHCDDKLSRGNADFGRILVRFYPFICQGCDSFCVGVFLISESCMLVHHGKIVQGAYGLITARSLKNLPAKALLSNHIWLKLALPTSFAILHVHHFTIHFNLLFTIWIQNPLNRKCFCSCFFLSHPFLQHSPVNTPREESFVCWYSIWLVICQQFHGPCSLAFSSIPLGDTHHKTSIMVSRHSCLIGSIWFSESGLPTNGDTKFQIFILQWNPPICKKKSKGKKRMANHYNCTRFYPLFFSSQLLTIWIYMIIILKFPPFTPLLARRWRRESLAEDLRRLAEAKRRVRREEAEEVASFWGHFWTPPPSRDRV